MSKGRRRGRIGVIVGRHINGLDRRDGTGFGRGDAFLHLAHFGRERRLVTHGGRHTAEKARHLGTGLRKAENIIDEKQHVVSLIAEIFGDRQARQEQRADVLPAVRSSGRKRATPLNP